MSLPTGSLSYRIVPSDRFTRDLKALAKTYKGQSDRRAFNDQMVEIVRGLTQNPRPDLKSRPEPWPGKTRSLDWEFRKLVFTLPKRQGASGQGRLMYLVNEQDRLIVLVWVYTHEQFPKRPPDQSLGDRLGDVLD